MIEPVQKDLDLYQSGRLAGAIQGNQQRLSRMAGGKVARTGGRQTCKSTMMLAFRSGSFPDMPKKTGTGLRLLVRDAYVPRDREANPLIASVVGGIEPWPALNRWLGLRL